MTRACASPRRVRLRRSAAHRPQVQPLPQRQRRAGDPSSRGRPFRVDDETARLLDYGAALWRLSEGAFDLTSGVLRYAWNFDEGPVVAEPGRIPELLDRIGWQRAALGAAVSDAARRHGDRLRRHRQGIRRGPRRRLGGERRRSAPCSSISAATCAAPARRRASGAWLVGIESLEESGQAVRRIELKTGALATSGDTRRHIDIEGVRYGHIFDARTGWPARRRAALRHRRRRHLLPGRQLLDARDAARQRRRSFPRGRRPAVLVPPLECGKGAPSRKGTVPFIFFRFGERWLISPAGIS